MPARLLVAYCHYLAAGVKILSKAIFSFAQISRFLNFSLFRLASLMDFRLEENSKTPLHACVQLLIHPGCSHSVQNRILTILKDLSSVSIDQDSAEITDGIKMLSPFVPDILKYMRKKLSEDVGHGDHGQETKKKRSADGARTLPALDLQLLSKLTVCVTEPEDSESLTILLLPGLGSKSMKSEVNF